MIGKFQNKAGTYFINRLTKRKETECLLKILGEENKHTI